MFTYPQALFALAFSPDGKRLAAGGEFQTVRIWDLASRKVVHDFHAHWGDICSLVFTPDNKTLLTTGKDNSTRIWSLADLPGPFPSGFDGPQPQAVFNVHKDWSMDGAFSQESDGMLAATGFVPLAVKTWNIDGYSDPWTFSAAETMSDNSVQQSIFYVPGTHTLGVCVSRHGKPRISLWDTKKRIRQAVFEPGSPSKTTNRSLALMTLTPDGTEIVVTSYEERLISMIELSTGKTRWSVPLPHDSPVSPAVSPNGRMVAVGTKQGLIMLLDTETGAPIREPLRHGEKQLWGVAFSSKSILASASTDGTVKLWDIESFQDVSLPPVHHESIWSAAFSPDGQMLVTDGGCLIEEAEPWAHEGEVCIWDVKNRKLLVKFHAHYGCVTRAVFSPSGKRLATTGRDGKMYLWDVAEILKE